MTYYYVDVFDGRRCIWKSCYRCSSVDAAMKFINLDKLDGDMRETQSNIESYRIREITTNELVRADKIVHEEHVDLADFVDLTEDDLDIDEFFAQLNRMDEENTPTILVNWEDEGF